MTTNRPETRRGRTASRGLAPIAYLLLLSLPGLVLSLAERSPAPSKRRIALVTGGTRGIGSGIAEALADEDYDLLLTYNTNEEEATGFSKALRERHEGSSGLRVECVGGDISLPETRDAIFDRLDEMMAEGSSGDDEGDGGSSCLAVMVHNAGQYVGITSDNSDGLDGSTKRLMFGDGSLLSETDGGRETTDLSAMRYYHRMYGEAFVDLCERSLPRMDGDAGGTLLGISSPGVAAMLYSADPSYSMPGSGKCLMEYSMRIYALKGAERNVTCNVLVPGVVYTDAWDNLAKSLGMPDAKGLVKDINERMSPAKNYMAPRNIGDVAAFLASAPGRWMTGLSLPVDGGLHLKH